jgi:hypothetical protein
MEPAGEKKFRPCPNTQPAGEVEKKHGRNEDDDVDQLIALYHRHQTITGRSGTVFLARADQTQIISEKNPADDPKDGAKRKPPGRIMQSCEENRLHQRARDVEKIMAEFQRPPDEGDDVQYRAGPKHENHKQTGKDVGPENGAANGDDVTRFLDQKGERDALDDTDEGKLDLDNGRVHLRARLNMFHTDKGRIRPKDVQNKLRLRVGPRNTRKKRN